MSKREFYMVMADDDLDDQYLVRRAVEEVSMSYVLNTVNNGSQLLDLLTKTGNFAGSSLQQPDCILLDLNMPLMDGFTTLLRLKRLHEVKHIPVYVFSTSKAQSDREKSYLLGASAFYVKPNQYGELKKIIGEICASVSQHSLSIHK